MSGSTSSSLSGISLKGRILFFASFSGSYTARAKHGDSSFTGVCKCFAHRKRINVLDFRVDSRFVAPKQSFGYGRRKFPLRVLCPNVGAVPRRSMPRANADPHHFDPYGIVAL